MNMTNFLDRHKKVQQPLSQNKVLSSNVIDRTADNFHTMFLVVIPRIFIYCSISQRSVKFDLFRREYGCKISACGQRRVYPKTRGDIIFIHFVSAGTYFSLFEDVLFICTDAAVSKEKKSLSSQIWSTNFLSGKWLSRFLCQRMYCDLVELMLCMTFALFIACVKWPGKITHDWPWTE